MSNSRQTSEPNLIVRSLALGLPPDHRIEDHAHGWPQVLVPAAGALDIETAARTWVVSVGSAVWLPVGVRHAITTIDRVRLLSIYLHPRLAARTVEMLTVLQVAPLLRELIHEVVRAHALDRREPASRRLAGVLADQVQAAPETPVELVSPRDPRALRLADHLRRRPADARPLPAIAPLAAASPRTLERLFRRETGMTVGQWRRRARLQHALRRLAEGATVTTVALETGYAGTSAFIAMFRGSIGASPHRWRAITGSLDPG